MRIEGIKNHITLTHNKNIPVCIVFRLKIIFPSHIKLNHFDNGTNKKLSKSI